MAGVDIFAAIAACVGLIGTAVKAIDRYNGISDKLDSDDKARLAASFQIDSLRAVLKGLSICLNKYNEEIDHCLERKTKKQMYSTLSDIKRKARTSAGTMAKLRHEIQQKSHKKSVLDGLRKEVEDTMHVLGILQGSFTTLICMENLKITISHPQSVDHNTSKIPQKQEVISKSSNTFSENIDLPKPERQGTGFSAMSERTVGHNELQRIPTVEDQLVAGSSSSPSLSSTRSYSNSTKSTPSTSNSTHSTGSSKSLIFTESKSMAEAIEHGDVTWLNSIVREGKSETQIKSRKASALLIACRYRRSSIVSALLTSGASTTVTDVKGLGVVHSAIGTSEAMDEATCERIVKTLRILVQHHVSVTTIDGSTEKLQPLHYCAMTGNYQAAKYILGVDGRCLNAVDANRKTPLYHCCQHHSPSEKLVRLLLDQGATFGRRGRPDLSKERYRTVKKLLNEAEKGRRLTEA